MIIRRRKLINAFGIKIVHTNDSYKEEKRKYASKLRFEVINHYGGKCVFCGDTNINHLCIDHINNNGAKHRKEIGSDIISWLKKNNYPDGFQVLCHNHNAEKQNYKTMTLATYDK